MLENAGLTPAFLREPASFLPFLYFANDAAAFRHMTHRVTRDAVGVDATR